LLPLTVAATRLTSEVTVRVHSALSARIGDRPASVIRLNAREDAAKVESVRRTTTRRL
jgi:hypothetical protein